VMTPSTYMTVKSSLIALLNLAAQNASVADRWLPKVQPCQFISYPHIGVYHAPQA
jgi:hypothetical protein